MRVFEITHVEQLLALKDPTPLFLIKFNNCQLEMVKRVHLLLERHHSINPLERAPLDVLAGPTC
jgi:hypothetical protein